MLARKASNVIANSLRRDLFRGPLLGPLPQGKLIYPCLAFLSKHLAELGHIRTWPALPGRTGRTGARGGVAVCSVVSI